MEPAIIIILVSSLLANVLMFLKSIKKCNSLCFNCEMFSPRTQSQATQQTTSQQTSDVPV